jgi:hypothetical protein
MSPIEECDGEQLSKSGRSNDPSLDRPHLHFHREPFCSSHCLTIPGHSCQTHPVIHTYESESKLSVSEVGTFEDFSTEFDGEGEVFAKINTIDLKSGDNIEIYNKSLPPRNKSFLHSPSLPEPPTNNDTSILGGILSGPSPKKSRANNINLSMITVPVEIRKPNSVHPIILINKPEMINLDSLPIENINFKKNLEPLSANCNQNDSEHEFQGIPDIADGCSTEELQNYHEEIYYNSNGMNELYKNEMDSKESVFHAIQFGSMTSANKRRGGILKSDKGIGQVILI